MKKSIVNSFKQTIMQLGLFVCLLFLHLTDVQAQAGATKLRASIQLNNVTVQQLVDRLGKDFKYSFFILDDQVSKTRVTVNKSNATINEILDEAFRSKEITYQIQAKNIIISKKKTTSSVSDTEKLISIKGTVMDANQQPIIGAIIEVQNRKQKAISDIDGKFSIEVPEKGQILVSAMGYKMQVLTLSGISAYKIVLEEEVHALEELVVVGYGTQKRANLTGSVSTLKTENLTIAPITNVTNALTGQLPGLRTKQTSGIPGSDGSQLSIRGFSSPLVIVDGVETNFDNIDASQIESISILKDGAASVYGARAGNGVILVTLKRGKEGKVTVIANASQTMQNSTALIATGSSGQRAEWEREAHINAGLPASQIPWKLSDIEEFYSGTNPNYLNTDWFSAAIRSWAPQQNHNISVSGGSDKVNFYSYVGYNKQTTIARKDGGAYDRINTQTSLDAKLTDRLLLSSSFNYIGELRDFTSMNLGHSNFYNSLYESDPKYPLTLPDPTMLSYAGTSTGNAVFVSNKGLAGYSRNTNKSLRLNSALTYEFKSIEGLKAKAFINYNSGTGFSKLFRKQPNFYSYRAATDEYIFERKSANPTMLYLGSYNSSDITQQYSFTYDRVFNNDHRFSGMLLHERINYNNESFDTQRGNLASEVIDQLFVGDPNTASNNGSASEMARKSYVGRFNYGYKGKYLIETIFRADASAKFPKDGRWGYFPSVSVGWVLSKEKFLENSTKVDNLKLRASAGQSGDDGIGNYQYYAGYSYDMSYILGDEIKQGLYLTGLANPNLSWEKLGIYNVGLDFSLFNSGIYGTVEGFYRLREGIPGYRVNSVPSSFGAALPLENMNSIDTRGFEFELGTKGKINQVSYDISGNISWARSKWVKYDEPDYVDADIKRINGVQGKWTDERWGYVSDGLFTSMDEIRALPYTYVDLGGNDGIRPGDVKYVDLNGDGKLDWKDRIEIGKGTVPNWMAGLLFNVSYKSLHLNSVFQGAWGYTTYIDLETAPTTLKYDNRWTSEKNNSDALVPRPGSKNVANWWYSDYRNHNTRYLRLRSLSLGYEFNDRILKSLKMSKLRVYAAGSNLFTITNLSKLGVDPEAPEGSAAYYYPQQRTVSIGLSLNY
ncbi:TonB-dependent receptor [Pseudopedobacter saltans DSM 12145]|uniref:TonB-dependent receptor n=1 Tax=Pseudopedobacter saltans (strain ATCC 51119 / DSM 12145 / JCM 21818 / CCUG 39354 / LMG 10337 / NBRC 100064 / NCIMB 13643) TaxID=762903 RepID=F0SA76_PSESL|nr:TonB-dependent receptor [Pseudopedobacter saltans]ADY53640.1 TonB-dependent receptor [Pseudopedobacter saltans DSM 12145]